VLLSCFRGISGSRTDAQPAKGVRFANASQSSRTSPVGAVVRNASLLIAPPTLIGSFCIVEPVCPEAGLPVLLWWKGFCAFSRRRRPKNRRPTRQRRDLFPATKTGKPSDTFSPCWKREALGAGRVPTVKKYLYGRAGAIPIKEETPYNLLAVYARGIAQGRRAATKEKRQAAVAMLALPIPPASNRQFT
jgi:hypothetical protein